MKMIFIFLLGLFVETATAQKQVAGAVLPSGDSTRVFERFYEDLSKSNLIAIRNSVFYNEKKIDLMSSHVYGNALVRSPNVLGINQIPRIADVAGIQRGFKSWTGLDLVEYRVLIVRYELSPRVKSAQLALGAKPSSKIDPFEEIYCDLWMCGTDGKWRVACDYSPAVDVNCQTLGLKLTKDEGEALEFRKQRLIEKEKSDDLWISVPTVEK